jgi:hypothetical protein
MAFVALDIAVRVLLPAPQWPLYTAYALALEALLDASRSARTRTALCDGAGAFGAVAAMDVAALAGADPRGLLRAPAWARWFAPAGVALCMLAPALVRAPALSPLVLGVLAVLATARAALQQLLAQGLPTQIEKYTRARPTPLQAYLLASLLCCGVEFAVGLRDGSLSLEADAWHMVADNAALALGVWIEHVREHRAAAATLGEYSNGLLLFVVAPTIALKSAERVLSGAPSTAPSSAVLWVAVAGLALNAAGLAAPFAERRTGVHAHILADLLGSLVAVSAAAFSTWLPWLWWADPLLAAAAAVYVAHLGVQMLRETAPILLEGHRPPTRLGA